MDTPPNILLIVWDACRLDAARDHAPTLADLAETNLWFENAITPAGHSLASHASMMTGCYPHEHGIYKQTHMFDLLPLLDTLGEEGYTRIGVSANGFASAKYGFDEGFDEFHNTQGVIVYPEGLDVHGYARKMREKYGEFELGKVSMLDLARATLGHEYPLKSILNVTAVGLSELVNTYHGLQRIPHPRFHRHTDFCYTPEQNTRLIESAIQNLNPATERLFLFANYMDPHHPYIPAERYQRECCGHTFSHHELTCLSHRTHPLNYLTSRIEGNELSTDHLQEARCLYSGEVRSADEHLARILRALEEQGVRDETLIIVTADHGENLGETNWMGEKHMGHVASASEHHLRVPLVIAHPAFEGRQVDDYVSLKDLYRLLTDGFDSAVSSRGADISPLIPDDGIVSAEVPAMANEVLEAKYPELTKFTRRHLAVCYQRQWKVVMSSTDDEYAWQNGEERDVAEAPDSVVDTCRNNLESLIATDTEERNLAESEISHLEALGYL